MPKYLVYLLITVFCSTSRGYSQKLKWAKQIGGSLIEAAYALVKDSEGNIIIAGVFTSTTDFDPGPGQFIMKPPFFDAFYVLKLDSGGNFLWAKQISSLDNNLNYHCWSTELHIDSLDNIYYSGGFRGSMDFDPGPGTQIKQSKGIHDAFFLKLSKEGDFVWVRTIESGNAEGTLIRSKLDRSGNFYALCSFMGTIDADPGPDSFLVSSSKPDRQSTFLIKLGPAGNTLFIHHLPGSNNSVGLALTLDQRGHLFIVGSFSDSIDMDPGPDTLMLSNKNGLQHFVKKMDVNGQMHWAKAFSLQVWAAVYRIHVTNNEEILISGRFSNVIPFGDTAYFNFNGDTFKRKAVKYYDAFVIKLTPDFYPIWIYNVGGTGDESAAEIHTDKLGNIFCFINYNSNYIDLDPGPQVWMTQSETHWGDGAYIKLSPTGKFLWGGNISKSVVDANLYRFLIDKNFDLYGVGRFEGTIDTDPRRYEQNLMSSSGSFDDGQGLIFKWHDHCLESSTGTWNITACGSYRVPSGDETYTQSGVYKDTIANHKGCDSFITINLTIIENSYTGIDTFVCAQYTAPDGKSYTKSGSYKAFLKNAVGCDSVISIKLTIGNTDTSFSVQSCSPYQAPDGNTYSQSGRYDFTIQSAKGCDSTIHLDLTVGEKHAHINAETCDRYTSPSGKFTWTQSGNFADTLVSKEGCDSILAITLMVKVVDTAVVREGDTLRAQAKNASFRWLDCNNGLKAVPGATSAAFSPADDGSYAVEVTQNGCTDTSACVLYTSFASGIKSAGSMHTYPNPTTGDIQVVLDKSYPLIEIRLMNAMGQIVLEKQVRNEAQFPLHVPGPKGSYILTISDGVQILGRELLIRL